MLKSVRNVMFAGCVVSSMSALAAPQVDKTNPEDDLSSCLSYADTDSSEIGCRQTFLSSVEARLERYRDAARQRLKTEGKPTDSFDAAETTWTAYSDTYCGSVGVRWKAIGSTIIQRTMMCKSDLARDHLHEVWADYLKWAPGMPGMKAKMPDLPEPKLPTDDYNGVACSPDGKSGCPH